MAANTTNFDEALKPDIYEWYGAEYLQNPEIYKDFFNVRSTNKKHDYTHSLAAFGLVPIKQEGEAIGYVDTKQGYKNTITQVSFALGFTVTKEMVMFEQYGLVEMLSRSLSHSVRQTIETTAANELNNAFDSSAGTGADGKELCSLLHPKLYGGTWQNEPTTASDLSMTSLEQAKIDINDFPDDRGLKIAAKPKQLIIPPELEWTAQQLFRSSKDPESDLNAINPAMNMMPYIVDPFLTDPDAWFMSTDVKNGLTAIWAMRPEFTRDNDTDSYNAKYKTFYSMAVGYGDARSLYGSPGGA